MRKMAMDVIEQTRNAVVPIGAFVGEAAGLFSLDNLTKFAVLTYTLLQAGFLVWRWNKARAKEKVRDSLRAAQEVVCED